MIKWDTLKTAADKLDEYKQSKKQWLNAERDRLIHGGINFEGNEYQTRPEDITNILGAVQVAQIAASQDIPYTTNWLTTDNQEVPMNVAQLAAFGVAVAQHKERLIYRCREHKSAILELDSRQAVDDYLAEIEW